MEPGDHRERGQCDCTAGQGGEWRGPFGEDALKVRAHGSARGASGAVLDVPAGIQRRLEPPDHGRPAPQAAAEFVGDHNDPAMARSL